MDGNLSTLSRFINSACKVIIMGSLIRGEDNSEGLPLDEGIGLKKFPSIPSKTNTLQSLFGFSQTIRKYNFWKSFSSSEQ